MKLIKFLVVLALAAGFGAQASAERYVIGVKKPSGQEVLSFGVWDDPGLKCQFDRTVSFELCNRVVYVCEGTLREGQAALKKHGGYIVVFYSDRPGRPRAC